MAADDTQSMLAQVDRGVLGLIQELFRSMARLVRVSLVNRANADLQVRFGTVEIASLSRVQARLQAQEGGAFGTFRVSPGNIPGIIVVQGPVLYRLTGIILGEGTDIEVPMYHWRPLTRVDLLLARRICEDVLDGLADAVSLSKRPTIALESVTGNPRIRYPLPGGTTVVEASLDLGPPDNPYGLISVVLPGQATGILWPSRTSRPMIDEDPPEEGIRRVFPLPVEVVASLAKVTMPMSRVRSLQVGDTIDLGSIREVEVSVGGRAALSAEPGEMDGHRSVRVIRRTLDAKRQLPASD